MADRIVSEGAGEVLANKIKHNQSSLTTYGAAILKLRDEKQDLLTAGRNISFERDGSNLLIHSDGGGGAIFIDSQEHISIDYEKIDARL